MSSYYFISSVVFKALLSFLFESGFYLSRVIFFGLLSISSSLDTSSYSVFSIVVTTFLSLTRFLTTPWSSGFSGTLSFYDDSSFSSYYSTGLDGVFNYFFLFFGTSIIGSAGFALFSKSDVALRLFPF